MEQSLAEEIRRAVIRAVEQRRDNLAENIVYVTDVSQCLRKTFLEYRYPQRKTKQMVYGEFLHTDVIPRIAKYLEGHKVEYEVMLTKDIEGISLVGRADLVVDGFPVELKFSNRVYDWYKLQAEYYAYMLNTNRYYIVLVTDYGYVDVVEYDRMYTDAELVDRVKRLVEHIRSGKEPEPERSEMCRFCQFRKTCLQSINLEKFVL